MKDDMHGMSIVVTGGGSGIGRAVAQQCVAAGARVTIAGRNRERLDKTVGELGPACAAVAGDVSDEKDRARVLDTAREHGGGIDALVHCAADLIVGPLRELTQHDLDRLLTNNLTSALMLTSAALPDLERSRGSVVFFSSAHAGRAFANTAAYAATKGALETVTRGLALELGPSGIRVNCVRPGAVPTEIVRRTGLDEAAVAARLEAITPMHALKRVGTPEQLAEAVLYLINAQWTTGSVLVVDGGLTLGG